MKGNFIRFEEQFFRLKKCTALNDSDLLLLSKIITLSQTRKEGCWAQNDYFAELMCVSVRTVQNYILRLKKAGLIITKEQKAGMSGTVRYITVQYDKLNELLKEDSEDIEKSVIAKEKIEEIQAQMDSGIDEAGMKIEVADTQFEVEDMKFDVGPHENSWNQFLRKVANTKSYPGAKREEKRLIENNTISHDADIDDEEKMPWEE